MNCRYVQSLLSAYLDSELTGTQQQAMRRHLMQCHECELEYNRMLRVKQVLSHMPLQTPSSWLEGKILHTIQQAKTHTVEPKTRLFDTFWGRLGWAVAVGVMIFSVSPKAKTNSDTLPASTSAFSWNLSPSNHDHYTNISQPIPDLAPTNPSSFSVPRMIPESQGRLFPEGFVTGGNAIYYNAPIPMAPFVFGR